ncbi:N-acetylmuramoyl-L-alanine amidase [Dysgonomonas sp. 216]|uniref:N-acetylmuramoyl-L-alanine amidase family protein n=1 Tax=Dysgonomonas sp. 216 TaxID=2302934 RepID=UPI0013D6A634|nr:N-acetylmuramoyl-L-alanine amidase [Dysgonomonas sp. 216]NDW19465.1 N-acetylmuramoyl-L-alanine amidase [Dysgonomonas sp. 216]
MSYIRIIFIFTLLLSTLGLFARAEKDKPRNGEGIHSFLKRNKRTEKEHYKQFLELNPNKFGKQNSLKMGVYYTLPPLTPKKTTASTPQATSSNGVKKRDKLFGPKYEEYTIKSDKLKGAVFFLSSGHGGPDCGAVGKVNGKIIHEDEYAYDITLRLARNLREEGATVHMIIQDAKDGIRDEPYLKYSSRETCMGEKIPLNQLKRLVQRSRKINQLAAKSKEKYKRSVFIHLDSRGQRQQLDVFFYHAPKSKEGQRLALTMKKTFNDHYAKHQPNRGFSGTVTPRGLYVLNNTSPVGIFAELGNIQNSSDQRRFIQPDNRQALANWMCRGFIADYENWKSSAKTSKPAATPKTTTKSKKTSKKAKK